MTVQTQSDFPFYAAAMNNLRLVFPEPSPTVQGSTHVQHMGPYLVALKLVFVAAGVDPASVVDMEAYLMVISVVLQMALLLTFYVFLRRQMAGPQAMAWAAGVGFLQAPLWLVWASDLSSYTVVYGLYYAANVGFLLFLIALRGAFDVSGRWSEAGFLALFGAAFLSHEILGPMLAGVLIFALPWRRSLRVLGLGLLLTFLLGFLAGFQVRDYLQWRVVLFAAGFGLGARAVREAAARVRADAKWVGWALQLALLASLVVVFYGYRAVPIRFPNLAADTIHQWWLLYPLAAFGLLGLVLVIGREENRLLGAVAAGSYAIYALGLWRPGIPFYNRFSLVAGAATLMGVPAAVGRVGWRRASAVVAGLLLVGVAGKLAVLGGPQPLLDRPIKDEYDVGHVLGPENHDPILSDPYTSWVLPMTGHRAFTYWPDSVVLEDRPRIERAYDVLLNVYRERGNLSQPTVDNLSALGVEVILINKFIFPREGINLFSSYNSTAIGSYFVRTPGQRLIVNEVATNLRDAYTPIFEDNHFLVVRLEPPT